MEILFVHIMQLGIGRIDFSSFKINNSKLSFLLVFCRECVSQAPELVLTTYDGWWMILNNSQPAILLNYQDILIGFFCPSCRRICHLCVWDSVCLSVCLCWCVGGENDCGLDFPLVPFSNFKEIFSDDKSSIKTRTKQVKKKNVVHVSNSPWIL